MSKSLREAAEAVLVGVDGFDVVGNQHGETLLRNLRAALSEPDPLTEAVELIEKLVEWEARFDVETKDRARDFLARMKGGGK